MALNPVTDSIGVPVDVSGTGATSIVSQVEEVLG